MTAWKRNFDDKDDSMTQNPKRSRITFDVSPELRRRIKMAADQQDLSIGEYLGRILQSVVPQEAEMTRTVRPVTRKTLDAFLRISQEIMQERKERPFSDSAEIIHEMREERSRELDQL
ncbi:MAG: hypothetical protein JO125_16400 [Chloroflexi bacterium]|nr:hypothetical protein [Ktedonobacteraceae bacterium]MBV9021480.1 hypothetical protein [Ktedonobacteraceae bacterium]MBV9708977.1 hypothetical protein [Chloroflexota bacterium]